MDRYNDYMTYTYAYNMNTYNMNGFRISRDTEEKISTKDDKIDILKENINKIKDDRIGRLVKKELIKLLEKSGIYF